jgi:hypothetical protein
MNIIGPKLRHLKIIECVNTQRIDINALNLASFEYNGYMRRNISVTAPRLLKIFWNAARREKNPHPFGPTITLQHIQNLAMILSTSQVSHSKTMFNIVCVGLLMFFFLYTCCISSNFIYCLLFN